MDTTKSPILTPREVQEVLARKGDLHTAAAAKAFNIPEAQVTAVQRAWAKSRNFAMMYSEPRRPL